MGALRARGQPNVHTARDAGIDVMIETDVLNAWAAEETPFVFHMAPTMDPESTGPMTTMRNVIIHAVASEAPGKSRRRIRHWPPLIAPWDATDRPA